MRIFKPNGVYYYLTDSNEVAEYQCDGQIDKYCEFKKVNNAISPYSITVIADTDQAKLFYEDLKSAEQQLELKIISENIGIVMDKLIRQTNRLERLKERAISWQNAK